MLLCLWGLRDFQNLFFTLLNFWSSCSSGVQSGFFYNSWISPSCMKMSAHLFPQQEVFKPSTRVFKGFIFHPWNTDGNTAYYNCLYTKPEIISKGYVQSLLKVPLLWKLCSSCRSKNVSDCLQKYCTVCDWRFVSWRWTSPKNGTTSCKANSTNVKKS